ncbi:hypothetical protein HAX54_028839 [Datura stramonium]|uniref:Uncharacterized protein n=1 Tax=Datura stramonium TaxID=4076 RepID=A0ABS8V674_DATST|nr:hypothetical protein [Datura stramonium]
MGRFFIGTPIVIEKATLSKIRLTTAKLRVKINLTKPLIHEISVEIRNPIGNMEINEPGVPLIQKECELVREYEVVLDPDPPDKAQRSIGTYNQLDQINLWNNMDSLNVDTDMFMECIKEDIISFKSDYEITRDQNYGDEDDGDHRTIKHNVIYFNNLFPRNNLNTGRGFTIESWALLTQLLDQTNLSPDVYDD